MLISFILLSLSFWAKQSRAVAYTSTNLRVKFDYESIKAAIPGISQADITYVAENVTAYLGTFISVFDRSFTIPSTPSCNGQTLASNLSGATYSDIDLLVSVSAANLGALTNVTGVPCAFDMAYLRRPILGLLTLNTNL